MQGFGAWSRREAVGVRGHGSIWITSLQAVLQACSELGRVEQGQASVHNLKEHFDQVECEAAMVVSICGEKQTRETAIEV